MELWVNAQDVIEETDMGIPQIFRRLDEVT
jgi:hypothetical protein